MFSARIHNWANNDCREQCLGLRLNRCPEVPLCNVFNPIAHELFFLNHALNWYNQNAIIDWV